MEPSATASPRARPSARSAAAIVATRIEPAFTARSWSFTHAGQARCQAFLVIEGAATADFAENDRVGLHAPAILWVPAGREGTFRLAAGGRGLHVTATEQFAWRAIADAASDVDMRGLMASAVMAGVERIGDRLDELWTSFEAMARETRNPEPGSAGIVGFHLGLVLMHLWRLSGARPASAGPGGGAALVQRFRQLIELHFRENLGIDGYASLLGSTRGRLHDACLKLTGETPLAIVHARLMDEARARLSQTDMSVEQVAFSLGFREAAYFNRFFRRHAGETPGAFRRASRNARQPSAEGSFAAWP